MKAKENTIILFGGSFDPIHKDHVSFVNTLQEKFPNALIVVMPSQNRFKESRLIPIEKRIEAVQACFKEFKNVNVVDWTLHWDTSSTLDVVTKIRESIYPNHNILIASGEDILSSLKKWKNFNLLKNEKWIFLRRTPGTINQIKEDPELKGILSHALIFDVLNSLNLSSTSIKSGVSSLADSIPPEAIPIIGSYLKRTISST
jgi:nicotinate (nicotinamide) nucleotide adenylyltransferase